MFKNTLKKITSCFLILSILFTNIITSNAMSFSDLPSNHWAKPQIDEFVKKGYINGYPDNTFKPNKQITRAEFIKIVNKVFEFKEIGEENFTDVSSSNWYYNEVCIAMNQGYINGYPDNTFRPNNPITREEATVIITNIKENKDTNYDKIVDFKDAYTIASWAKSSVEGAIEAGYIGGYPDKTIQPKKNISRAEAVVTLSRVIEADNIEIMYTTGNPVLNVHEDAGTQYKIIGTLPYGTKVEVLGIKDGWAKIKYKDGYGYVSGDYLTEQDLNQKPLPELLPTPNDENVAQPPGITDSSQDVHQSKIIYNVEYDAVTNMPRSLSVKSKNNDFGVNYSVYSSVKETSTADGAIAQAPGQNPIEGIKIALDNAPSNYHIFYRTKLTDHGWQAWVKDGEISGQIGNNQIVEDIQIRLILTDDVESLVMETIAIDIGHNVERVTKGAVNGIYKEDFLTKAVGEKVIYKLKQKGYNVINTLPNGKYTHNDELAERVKIANSNNVDKFVSIHFNSFDDKNANGTEVYYSDKVGASSMATNVLNNIVNEFGFKNRGIKPSNGKHVLEYTNMPAILIEGCFITNQEDMDKFIAKGEQAYDLMADAIVEGIIK